MKRFVSLALIALITFGTAFAGPGRSGGSSSSSSSRSSSSSSSSRSSGSSYGSYSSQRSSTPSQSSGSSRSTTSYGSFGSGSSKPTMSTTSRPQVQAAWARSQQASSAAEASKASLAKFKAPAMPAPAPEAIKSNPTFSKVYSGTKPTYQTYRINRRNYYRSYNPPVYVYNVRPSYGVWDTMFMFMMLDSMNHSMYYNHRNDSDWAAWRADANKQAETNAELKAKLAAMDAKVKELEAAKTPVNPAYMPDGVDPSVAMSIQAAETTLRKEAPPTNPDAVEWDNSEEETAFIGKIFLWILGIGAAIVAGFFLWSWNETRKARNSYSSRYRL